MYCHAHWDIFIGSSSPTDVSVLVSLVAQKWPLIYHLFSPYSTLHSSVVLKTVSSVRLLDGKKVLHTFSTLWWFKIGIELRKCSAFLFDFGYKTHYTPTSLPVSACWSRLTNTWRRTPHLSAKNGASRSNGLNARDVH